MENLTPSWLNVDFIDYVLRKSETDDSIQVCDIFVKPATNKGDNYTSDMLRVNVEYTRKMGDNRVTEKKSVIVKIFPQEEGMRRELIGQVGFFEVEMLMMSNTLRKMNALLEPGTPLSARGLYSQAEEPILLVFEDLAPLGFRMADRQAGLDLNHCLLAIRGLAKFHATSVAICEKEPIQKRMYNGGMCNSTYPPAIAHFFIQGAKTLANELVNWPEAHPRFAEKVLKLSDHFYRIGCKTSRMRNDEFNVITHGDVWVNNMLFRYNDAGKPIDHIFVDFQLCSYTSPAIDLQYFLNTSPSVDVYNNQRDLLLKEYIKTLSSTMKQIGCKTEPITHEQLNKAMKERAFFGMLASFTVLPLVLLNKDDAKGLDEIMKKDGEYCNPAYKGELYRKTIVARLPIYEELGLLDIK